MCLNDKCAYTNNSTCTTKNHVTNGITVAPAGVTNLTYLFGTCPNKHCEVKFRLSS